MSAPSASRGRRSRLALRALAIAFGLGVVFMLGRAALFHPLEVVGGAPDDGYTRIQGAIHIHTTYSDGGGTPQEVAAAARAEGLDFAIITDHNNVDAKPFEGYHDGVLVIVGSEISTDAGHLLGLGIDAPSYRFSGGIHDSLDDVRFLGGVPIAAHPLRAGGKGESTWSAWDLPGPWGMELVNGKSQWLAASSWQKLHMLLTYPVNSRYALLLLASSPVEELARWDELLAKRHVAGTLGADAHGRIPLWKGKAVRFPPYGPLLGLIQNHIVLDAPLSGEAAADKRAVIEAIQRGRAYIGIDGLAPANDVSFVATSDAGKWTMGDMVAPRSDLALRVSGRYPRDTRIKLYRDGRMVKEGVKSLALDDPEVGIYRVEAYVPGWSVPWIITNPIYVLNPREAEERAARGAWPEDAPVPEAARIIDAFDGATSFALEFDPSSSMGLEFAGAEEGAVEGQAARIGFHLGVPTPETPNTWCALVSRGRRDLDEARGLVFSMKADGVYRVWIQVRDENPASADEGTEWWFGSVRTSTEWRRLALPFDRLRSDDPETDGRLDLDRVRALVFVLDRGAVSPGTEGTLWLDDLGLY